MLNLNFDIIYMQHRLLIKTRLIYGFLINELRFIGERLLKIKKLFVNLR